MIHRLAHPGPRKLGGAPSTLAPAQLALQLQQGVAHHQQGKLQQAQTHYEAVLHHAPRNLDALHLLGVVAAQTRNPLRALALFDQALEINPAYADAWSNRGIALKELTRFAQALESFDKALTLKPGLADAHNNRGLVLHELQRLDDALTSYEQALKLRPQFAQAHYNRGCLLNALNRYNEAIEAYDRALALLPGYAEARFNKSIALLRHGAFEEAWPLYESRWDVEHAAYVQGEFAAPLWLGQQPLHGKTILLRAEQGLGDNLQFCRYATLLAAQGAQVVLETPKPLMRVLAGLVGVDTLVEKGKAAVDFDYHCPLLSLPLALNTAVATIPTPGAYLAADTAKAQAWSVRLGAATRPRVGLVWSGNRAHKNDANRSLSLGQLLGFLPSGCEYISLQKEVRSQDREALAQSHVAHFGEVLDDFSDTAALCAQLDVVLSVDTSVAHLAGAMGKSTWLLLPLLPDWRWLLERNDSPWYPSMKLYRQSASHTWEPVLARVGADLQTLALGWEP